MRQIIGLVLFVLASTLLHAQDLTDSEIQKWTKAYEAIIKWSQTNDFDKDFIDNGETADDGKMFSNMIEQSKASKHYSSLAKVLKQNGYSDPEQWASTSDRIMTAYVANLVTGKEAQMNAQLQQMETMLSSGMIPAEQKPMMEKMLAQSKATLKAAATAPEADKAAVARNQGHLEDVLKRQSEAAGAQ